MRDDLLKEQLMSYARDAAEVASQPAAEDIHRRARRRYRRLAALAVTGVLLAGGVVVGLGLNDRGTTPTVRPQPPATNPAPAVTSTTATTPARVTGEAPETFVANLGSRVAVVSTATVKIVRTLFGPHPSSYSYAVGLSPDRTRVYFSSRERPCEEPGIFRVPLDGGPATRLVADETATGPIATSADGSRLAYVSYLCPSTGRPTSGLEIVLRHASGALLHRWSVASVALSSVVSLSPDGRQLAVPVFQERTGFPIGVRLLDANTGTSIGDGRLITAPDPGCALVNAAFQPRTGRLAAFERCLPKDLQSGVAPRFRLVSLDPASGRPLSRSLAFDDHTGADLDVSTMDFDRTGRHLLYSLGSSDPADSQQPRPSTGTWRYSGGRPVRIHDDLRIGSGAASQLITSITPSW